MAKGIVYVMTTAVNGIIKIGRTEINQFKNRMKYLEDNGYRNRVGLKCYCAFELPNFDEKEKSRQAQNELQVLVETGELDLDLVFKEFNEGLYFPANATGKQTLTYCDDSYCQECKDYLGVSVPVMELSYIHMEPQSYYLSQTIEYLQFLEGFRDASL